MGPELLRRVTDDVVLDAVLRAGRLTRAELASAADISKPTASESVRRLVEGGVLVEAGRQEGGRGRTGTYYRVAERAGLALVVHAGSGELVGECVTAAGATLVRVERPVGVTIAADRLAADLTRLIADLEREAGRPVIARALSVADPVDLAGRLVHLPGSPFVLGEADLGAVVGPAAVVDNDVNWAAHAEAATGRAASSFLYLHLGAGFGAAVVEAGVVVRGCGVAGEIGYVVTADERGRARPLLEAFAERGLCVAGSSTLDVGAIARALDGSPQAVLTPLGGALNSALALLDPAEVVVGGPWGPAALAAGLAEAIPARGARVPAPIRPARVADGPFAGARARAVDLARAALLDPA